MDGWVLFVGRGDGEGGRAGRGGGVGSGQLGRVDTLVTFSYTFLRFPLLFLLTLGISSRFLYRHAFLISLSLYTFPTPCSCSMTLPLLLYLLLLCDFDFDFDFDFDSSLFCSFLVCFVRFDFYSIWS